MSDPARPRRPWDRTDLNEREYFDLLGPGLVAVLPPRRPASGGEGEWRPPTGGAWVHVGADGRIRAFTGKAEVGQGTRSALALVVAEELRVPGDRVSLVMADTDLCPWDMGTFGSRSMPDAARALAVAAAGARETLIGLASERERTPRTELEAADGEVHRRGGATGTSYSDLVADRNRVELVDPSTPTTPAVDWQRAGRAGPTSSPEATEVVTGRRVYASDVRRPGMWQGVVLWPPVYGARLTDVDVGTARKRPGITVVHDGDFVGVAAETMPEARAGLAEVRAHWDLPTQPGEVEIETYLRTHPLEGDAWDTDSQTAGDAETAYSTAPARVESTYRTAYIAHTPLEPHAAVAEWTGNRLTVWVGTQTPFRARDQVAEELGIAVEDVRVIVPATGAGFGGKHGGEISTAAARLARVAGRPVRVSYSREEEFRYAYFRPMSVIDVRAAATSEGKLSAWLFHNVNGGAAALVPPYAVANLKVDNELSRSPLPQGPYRALAATANNFARESAIDELARQLGLDPLEIRDRNLDDERLRTVLRRASDRAGWRARVARPGKGYGLAIGREKGSRVATIAEVTVDDDRRLHVDRLVTAFEAGAIVNPENLRSQVEGAAVMGLGGALFEAIRFGPDGVLNPRLSEYRVPRFSDLPLLEVELVDAKEFPPAGAGETPIIAVAPAVANAIFDATGCRIRSLPLVPDGRVPDPAPG
jgi:nicotinate dehydrogenase subunit B